MKNKRLFLFIVPLILFSCKFQPTPNETGSKNNGRVYYSLFVRSFADSNDDGTGDFNGITAKLDYLNDGNPSKGNDLGINGIWLLPVFPSHQYHGYEADDYYSLNPEYGTMEDFENLIKEASKRGIDIIMDIPFNHSSIYNEWFTASMNPADPHRNWYRWVDPDNLDSVNINASIWKHKVWNKADSIKSHFPDLKINPDADLNSYYAGLFYEGMPDFNLDCPELREEFKNVLKFWLDKGISGFRFDAAGHVYNSVKLPLSDKDGQKKSVEFWEEMCGYVKSVKPDAFMVGEVWENTGTRAEYMKGLPATFHFDMGTKIINAIKNKDGFNNSIAKSLSNDYRSYAEKNPAYIDCPFLSNHDQARTPLLMKNDPDSIKLAASMYIFAEGVPFVYYGEEIAMNGAKPDEQIRTPFLWDEKGNDKYQTSWLESDYNEKTAPLSLQQKEKDSIFNYYKKIISLKESIPSLATGHLLPADFEKTEITAWYMKCETEKCLVIFNLADKQIELDIIPEDAGMKILFSSKKESAVKSGKLTVAPKSTVILK